jgi:uncharacterized RDD family membrane protein YckC
MTEMPAPPPAAVPTFAASGPSGPRASFGRRLVALLVDTVILLVVGLILRAILGRTGGGAVSLVVGLGYYGYLEGSSSGQTVGKKLLGIRVIDFSTGGPIGFGRGLLRYVGKLISSVVCFLGFFWMLWDKEKQTWADKIATTVVVPVSAYPVANWPG